MDATITLDGQALPYRWRRSARRRTAAITIHPDRGVVVHTPRGYPFGNVEALLREKANWIQGHLERMAAQREALPARRWETGALLPYRGQEFRLAVTEGSALPGAWLAGGELRVALGAGTVPGGGGPVRAAVEAWYRERAVETFQERLAFYQPAVGAEPVKMRVKAQQRRWGSCSAKGAVNLNWRLILAPPAVLDYVVVHELCHLVHLNHSPRFWALVERVLPGYREHRAWLRRNGERLML